MEVIISKIKQKPGAAQEFAFTAAIDPAACGYGEYTLVSPVTCTGRLTNDGNGVYSLTGVYQAQTELICSRCGQPFTQSVGGEVTACFVDGVNADWDGERSVFDIEGEKAVLDTLLAGEIFFSLPMQPLCRQDCRGLCPQCGKNLNTGSCSCQAETIDPRWEKLKAFVIDD